MLDEALWKKIEAVDLTPILFKLTHSQGEGWSAEFSEEMVTKYRRFLYLAGTSDGARMVPTEGVDRVWHHHVLDTRKYMDDCSEIFGRVVHHFPYFGMRGPEDRQALLEAFEKTRGRYNTVFDGDYLAAESATAAQYCANCGGSD